MVSRSRSEANCIFAGFFTSQFGCGRCRRCFGKIRKMPFLEKKPDGITSLLKKVAGELLLN
tara:strand:- start:419 stop:601 length:183 start_codon:yes stop_codon:yes gene_type:complete